MAQIKYTHALDALAALLRIAEMENIPAIPTGMAIRRGIRLLRQVQEDGEAERLKLIEKHVERNEAGDKVASETNPDGSPRAWKMSDLAKFSEEYTTLLDGLVEVPWSMPASLFTGISLKPALLAALGDLLIDETD
jgi:hypothetical protein